MRMLAYLYRQSWQLLGVAAVTGVLSGLAGASLVAVLGEGIGVAAGAATAFALKFFGLALAYLAMKSAADLSLLHLTQGAVCRLRVELSRKVLATPLTALNRLGKHRLQAILTKDIDVFVQAFQLLPMVFSESVLLLACLAYMAWISWPVFLIFALTLAVCMLAYHLVERAPLAQLVKVRAQTDRLYKSLRGLIEGSRELKLNARRRGQFLDQVIGNDADALRRSYVRAMSGYTWVLNLGTILFYLIAGAILFVVPQWLTLPVETLTLLTLVLLYLFRPLSDIMGALPALRQAGVSLERIEDLERSLGLHEMLPTGPDPFAAEAPLALELRAVCHQAPGADGDAGFTLGPMSLRVRQGEVLFVVGGNGSGKTTLAMLLLGLYAPERGEILLNGEPVTDTNREHYRQYFSAVLADFHLFEQVCADPGTGLEVQANAYLQAFGMAHKVRLEDGRFSTIDLSSGQRKRLALVAAYLEDRPIYLFDEWAADQDPVFKKVFYTELLPGLKARGKSVIVISHDDAYFGCADRIVKLVDGNLQHILHAA